MANHNGDAEAATAPSKEQDVNGNGNGNGQPDATEEEGVNGQQLPDSMFSIGRTD
jgi:hypothetical protein